ncbi:MAG: hypothetical protein M3Q70_00370 [bacterium]|nr:hypothetical protein [bacterium]
MAKVEIKQESNVQKNLVIFVVGAIVSYALASIAIDRGMIWYFPTFAAIYITLRALYKLIRRK